MARRARGRNGVSGAHTYGYARKKKKKNPWDFSKYTLVCVTLCAQDVAEFKRPPHIVILPYGIGIVWAYSVIEDSKSSRTQELFFFFFPPFASIFLFFSFFFSKRKSTCSYRECGDSLSLLYLQ